MRTTLDIDDAVLADIVEITGQKNKSKAVNEALRKYLQWKAAKELIALAGQIDMVDDRDERRRLDLERWETLDQVGRLPSASGE
jgi:Arc/MetJ family transcription regulator